MAQYDVYPRRGGGYLVDGQSDLLRELPTRLVVPIVAAASVQRLLVPRLHPRLKVDGVDCVLMTDLLATVPRASLGRRITSLAHERHTILNALDVLLTGV